MNDALGPAWSVPYSDLLAPHEVQRHFREQAGPVDAVPTPLASWNRACRDEGGGVGLARGWHVIVASNTGFGKSVTALNLAATAVEHGERVGFVSLEMSRAQVATRLYAILTGIDIRQLERGALFNPDGGKGVERMVAEIRERTRGEFLVNERQSPAELDRVIGIMKFFSERHGCRYLVLDYVQLVHAADEESLFKQVTIVSMRVREVASSLGLVTVALSQFNRTTSTKYRERPTVQGLFGGSPLENDSDQTLLLDHSRFHREGQRARTFAILGKNRHGNTVDIPVEFDFRTLRIREAEPDEEAEWPR